MPTITIPGRPLSQALIDQIIENKKINAFQIEGINRIYRDDLEGEYAYIFSAIKVIPRDHAEWFSNWSENLLRFKTAFEIYAEQHAILAIRFDNPFILSILQQIIAAHTPRKLSAIHIYPMRHPDLPPTIVPISTVTFQYVAPLQSAIDNLFKVFAIAQPEEDLIPSPDSFASEYATLSPIAKAVPAEDFDFSEKSSVTASSANSTATLLSQLNSNSSQAVSEGELTDFPLSLQRSLSASAVSTDNDPSSTEASPQASPSPVSSPRVLPALVELNQAHIRYDIQLEKCRKSLFDYQRATACAENKLATIFLERQIDRRVYDVTDIKHVLEQLYDRKYATQKRFFTDRSNLVKTIRLFRHKHIAVHGVDVPKAIKTPSEPYLKFKPARQ